jgi:hypothetical protein
MPRSLFLIFPVMLLALGGCASTTTVQLKPSPQEPVCESSTNVLILWGTKWRADQKDVLAREAAAADGFAQFFEKSGCFRSVSLQRLPQNSWESTQAVAAEATTRYEKVVLIAVRELGPTVKIGASLALLEGGTEVVLEVSEFTPAKSAPRTFTAQWRSGGPGVLKGVATLPQDMQAALKAALQPPAR